MRMPTTSRRPVLGNNDGDRVRPKFAVNDGPSVQPEISHGRLLSRLFRDKFPPNFMLLNVVMCRRYGLAEAIFVD